jgi:flap endonuclease-1
MGIEQINKTLKYNIEKFIKQANDEGHNIKEFGFRTGVPLSFFSGKKIAFDSFICIHAILITAHNEIVAKTKDITQIYDRTVLVKKTFKSVIEFFNMFLKEDITPICVFDGKKHPFKIETVQKRVEIKEKKTKKIDDLMDNYRNTFALDRTKEMENEIRDEMKHDNRVEKSDIILMKEIMGQLGIACLTAEYDGEKLCSSLYHEKIVSAVYGNDTDNYPLGTGILITKVYWNGTENVCDIVNLEEIKFCLSNNYGFQFTQKILIDLCILHKCDFNSKMKIPTKTGNSFKSVGPKTAEELIKLYKTFEYFPQNIHQYLKPLNIDICRNIFYYTPSEIINNDTDINWDNFRINYKSILDKYELPKYIESNFSSQLLLHSH